MIDIEKHVVYLRNEATEDWTVATELVNSGRGRHGLFFAHLSLEKLIKARICRHTQDIAPRIHNLVKLAETAELSLTQRQIDILAEMNVFNIEGRYPDSLISPLSHTEAHDYLLRSEEVYQWLIRQL
ncbi:MAG: HEPN domain-containing protein [Proteobacteria bacterium]|nr:HEPN domain-containing protein [Pseudomonadota bacterium]